jgi:hypothetical protein
MDATQSVPEDRQNQDGVTSGLPPAADERTGSPLPPPPSRRRPIGAIFALVSAAILIANVLLGLSAGEDEAGPSTGTPGEDVMLRDDFSDSDSGWPEQRTKQGMTQYVDGVYKVSLNPRWYSWERFLNGSPVPGVSVEADVLPVGGAAGIACGASKAPGSYYAFTVGAGTDHYWIFQATRSDFGQTVAGGRSRAIAESATNHIRAECVAGTSGEPTNLTMWVNGSQVAHVEDPSDIASFDAMGLIVLSLRSGHIHADFDNAVARKAS